MIGGALARTYSARSGRGRDPRPQDHPRQLGQELRPLGTRRRDCLDRPRASARDSPKSASGRILPLITASSAARVKPVRLAAT